MAGAGKEEDCSWTRQKEVVGMLREQHKLECLKEYYCFEAMGLISEVLDFLSF